MLALPPTGGTSMKFRILTAGALALALSGCSTYSYVDDGGGYYHGRQVSTVRSYDYYPGVSYGLGYGYYGYSDPLYRGYRYPNAYYGHPRHPPVYPYGPTRPQQGSRPPQAVQPGVSRPPPRSDRAPWRDLERLRDSHDPETVPRSGRREIIGAGGRGPRAEGGAPRTMAPDAVRVPRSAPETQRTRPQRMEPRQERRERPMGRNVRNATIQP